jgi:hypothetical protein
MLTRLAVFVVLSSALAASIASPLRSQTTMFRPHAKLAFPDLDFRTRGAEVAQWGRAFDFDGDGDVDILYAKAWDAYPRWLVNTVVDLHAPVLARLGLDFEFRMRGALQSGTLFGIGQTFVGRFGLASPIVTPFGAFWLAPPDAVALPPVVLPPHGPGVSAFTLPNDLSLAGVRIHAQNAIASAGLAGIGVRLSGVAVDRVVR